MQTNLKHKLIIGAFCLHIFTNNNLFGWAISQNLNVTNVQHGAMVGIFGIAL